MIDLKSLKPSVIVRPPKIIIYGTSKIGKSTFASQAPNPVVLDLENGMDSIPVAKHKVKDFSQVMEFMRELYKQEHDFKYLVVDSIDWLERLMIEKLCQQYNAKTLNDRNCKAFAYGAGERLLLTMWNQFIAGLDFLHQEKNMGIILIGHNQIKKFDDPLTESYDQHSIKLEKKSGERLKEWVDCILFTNLKVRIEEEKQGFGTVINRGKDLGRVIHTERRPSFEAGNRFNLPPEIECPDKNLMWQAFYKHFNKYYENLSKIMPQEPNDRKEEVKNIEDDLITAVQVAFLQELLETEQIDKILVEYKITSIDKLTVNNYHEINDKIRLEEIAA